MPPSARTSCATWTRANCNEIGLQEPLPASPPHGAHDPRDRHGGDGVRPDPHDRGRLERGRHGSGHEPDDHPPSGVADLPDSPPVPERDIYPGSWQWVVRGIYTGRDPSTDETQMFFQYAYLYEQVRQREPGRPVDAGFYVLRVGMPDAMARVAAAVDTQFVNSRSPTKTESERE